MTTVRFAGKTKLLDQHLSRAREELRKAIDLTAVPDKKMHSYYRRVDDAYGKVQDLMIDMTHDGAKHGKIIGKRGSEVLKEW